VQEPTGEALPALDAVLKADNDRLTAEASSLLRDLDAARLESESRQAKISSLQTDLDQILPELSSAQQFCQICEPFVRSILQLGPTDAVDVPVPAALLPLHDTELPPCPMGAVVAVYELLKACELSQYRPPPILTSLGLHFVVQATEMYAAHVEHGMSGVAPPEVIAAAARLRQIAQAAGTVWPDVASLDASGGSPAALIAANAQLQAKLAVLQRDNGHLRDVVGLTHAEARDDADFADGHAGSFSDL
jgi:hypothetical protein